MADYRMRPEWLGMCAIYRYFNCIGELIYVGISGEPWFRHAAHARRDWMSSVAYRKLEWFPKREVAEWAETEAIENEKPLANLNPGRAHDVPRWAAPWFFKQNGCKPVGWFHEWHTIRVYSQPDDLWNWDCLDECERPHWAPEDGSPMPPGPQTIMFISVRSAA